MLSPETHYPYPGSYALHIDYDQPPPQGAELVRIQWRRGANTVGRDGSVIEGAQVVVAFPLRLGAGGNKAVPEHQLIDPTPLSDTEKREMADLLRETRGRIPRSKSLKAKFARCEALRQRCIWSDYINPLLVRARALDHKRRAA